MIVFANLAVRRGVRQLFHSANLSIHPQQKVGLTGANGTGKSTLFALLLDELEADEGEVTLPASWVIAHVRQETPSGDISAIDYVLQGDGEYSALQAKLAVANDVELGDLHAKMDAIDGYTAKTRAAILLQGLGFLPTQIDDVVKTFSGGWRMRLNLAQALMCRSDLLLLDEPTNHLDLDAVIWLQDWLMNYQGTMILISHDRTFLDGTINYIAHLEHEALTLYTGNYSQFEKVRAERLSQQQSAYEKQQREIAHMQQFVDRFRAQATKAKQAQSRVKALQRLSHIAPAHVDSPFTFQFLTPNKLPDRLLTVKHASLGYNNSELIGHISLDLSPGDRLGLVGTNGSGKSTVIKYLAGELAALDEDSWYAKDLNIGYFAQHQLDQLNADQSPLEHLRALDKETREQQLRDYLGGYGFQGQRVDDKVAPFSGGEKARLALALIVYERPNVLLLDEPTNHLDIEMRQAIVVALQSYMGAIVIVSHDRYLLQMVTDQLLLVHGGKMSPFEGDLDDYEKHIQLLAKQHNVKVEPSNLASSKDSKAKKKLQRQQEAERRKQLQPLRNKVKKLELTLDKASTKQRQIQALLAESSLYEVANKNKLKQLLLDKKTNDQELESVEEQWLEASEAYEAVND
ncbi:MAG: ATP-binding cassette domain-containing protein [Thiotrichaceae bacterium]|nr:ATP-binding cassette domain-containing protein [Thiotrichaceae bacterium]